MFGPAKGGHFGVQPGAGYPGGVCQPAAGTKAGPAGVWPVGTGTDTMWRLRCKAKDGTHILQGLSSRTRVRELQSQIAAITGIAPGCQRVLVGYPPECLDLSNGDTTLGHLPIQSGKGIGAGALGGRRGARGRTVPVKARRLWASWGCKDKSKDRVRNRGLWRRPGHVSVHMVERNKGPTHTRSPKPWSPPFPSSCFLFYLENVSFLSSLCLHKSRAYFLRTDRSFTL